MKKTIIPILFILLGLSSAVYAQKEVTLRLNPKVGDSYTVKTKNTTMNMMDIQGQNMTMTQSMETRQSFTIKSVNGQEITVEEQADALKLTISQMGMTLTYDSEHPENTSPMLAGQTEELEEGLKKPYTVKYDNMGNRITSDEDADSKFAQLGNVITQLPEEPLKVGSTWSSKKDQEINGTDINATMTYTVTKISKKSVDIDVNGTIEGSGASGTYDGTCSIDPNTGLLIQSSIKQNISVTITEQGMDIPMTMTGTTTVTVE